MLTSGLPPGIPMDRQLSALKYRWVRTRGVAVPPELALPDFLGIGVPQGATTWLFEVLRKHPEIYLPAYKETEYFNRKFYRSLRWYSRHFQAGEGRIRGEITPGYCILEPSQIEVVHAILPEARILLTLRHPVDRAWSAARRILGLLGRRELAFVDEDTFLEVIDSPGVRARTDYPRILENWLAVYPQKQVHVEFYEDVVRNPRGLVERVLRHVGASTDVDFDSLGLADRVNRNPTRDIPPRFEDLLFERYSRDIDRIIRRFGPRAPRWRRDRAAEAHPRAV